MLLSLFSSLFCQTPFAGLLLRQGDTMQYNIEKAALQESGAFLPLSCGFQAPTFRHPHLGPADHPS